MHFSEIRGFMLLTALLTCGILLATRLAPPGMSRPGEAMSTAIQLTEKKAANAGDRDDAARARAPSAMPSGGGGSSSPLVTTILSGGHSCAAVRRVVPIDAGNGIYRVVCAGAGGDVSYRIDTRRGGATPEGTPIA